MKSNENKIFEKLSKFKEVKKEQLGAIEDAIADAQAEALGWIDAMKTNYSDLENTIGDTLDTIMTQIDILDSYSKELQSEYLDANENFREVNQGLLDNGIDGGQFNEDVVKEMTSNYQNMISNVVRLVDLSNQMARS
jgi:hypothetical protein